MIDGATGKLSELRERNLWMDENRLQQIFYNLVGNAVKFTASGNIQISAEQLSSGKSEL